MPSGTFFCVYLFILKKSSTFAAAKVKTIMKEVSTKVLLDTIVEGIRNKKGHRIVSIDLRKVKDAPVEYMVVAEGNSNTRTQTHVHPLATAGEENAEWIAMDYGTIFVHIMLREPRSFYDIENLWSDGKQTEYKEAE